LSQTLIVIKPDGVKRKLVGEIISRIERKGFEIIKLNMFTFTREQAVDFYSTHSNESFFEPLVEFVTSGPVVAIVLDGENAVNTLRLMIGLTRSYEASPGTIRGDFGLGTTTNIIHASDSSKSFERESRVIF